MLIYNIFQMRLNHLSYLSLSNIDRFKNVNIVDFIVHTSCFHAYEEVACRGGYEAGQQSQ